jgi:hypothetical protein
MAGRASGPGAILHLKAKAPGPHGTAKGQKSESASGKARGRGGLGALNPAQVAPMSKLYAGFLVIAAMLALSALGTLGLVLLTHLINFLP